MHYHYIDDARGDVVDLVPFCSAACRKEWCERRGIEYPGWNGCREGGDSEEYCAACGVICHTANDSCQCQRDNVIVNRFITPQGERCKHGSWIQLPSTHLRF